MFCVLYSGVINLDIPEGERRIWKVYSISLALGYYILTIIVQGSCEVYPYAFDFTNYY